MTFKFILFAAILACAYAGALPIAGLAYSAGHNVEFYGQAYKEAAPVALANGPVAVAHAVPVAEAPRTFDSEYDPHPQYSYAYDVHDSITGDVKSHSETRDGDLVRGSYSLIEADGSRRVVEYAADSHSGFNAVVHKEPAAHAVAAPVAHAHGPAPIAIDPHGRHKFLSREYY